jgi:hypothetical protein
VKNVCLDIGVMPLQCPGVINVKVRPDFFIPCLAHSNFERVGKKLKSNFIFSLFAHLAKCMLKYLAEDKIKIKIYSGIKFCSETGLNTLIFSCFACFGAPYLQ